MVHVCSKEAYTWFDDLQDDDVDVSFGALVDTLDGCVVKNDKDPVWMLEVNGNEYRGPIRFCPFCGVKLETSPRLTT